MPHPIFVFDTSTREKVSLICKYQGNTPPTY